MKAIIKKKINYMTEILFELLSNEKTDEIINFIFNNREKGVIFCGVGKNWYIAQKLTKTFISLGIPAQALDAIHALHGDIGMINNQTIFFISKSGNTFELISLIEYLIFIRDKKIIDPFLIGVSLNSQPKMKELTDLFLCSKGNKIYEFDDRNIVPTLSINILQMLLDYVGVEIYEKSVELTENYKFHHPGGIIGEKFKKDLL